MWGQRFGYSGGKELSEVQVVMEGLDNLGMGGVLKWWKGRRNFLIRTPNPWTPSPSPQVWSTRLLATKRTKDM